MKKIYRLSIDTESLSPVDNYSDDDIEEFLGEVEKTALSINELNYLPEKYEIPEKVQFRTHNEERLKKIHIPLKNTSLDVISNELIEIIKSVGDINWQLVPVEFVSESLSDANNNRFRCIFFNEHTDAFDYEKSVYEERNWSIFPDGSVTDRMRKVPAFIEKLVLKQPPDGFPPCFRLLADPARGLLVTEECRKAILEAKIKHLMFAPIGN